jgi:RNA polymerase sigma-70 factor (ECF subfamily)
MVDALRDTRRGVPRSGRADADQRAPAVVVEEPSEAELLHGLSNGERWAADAIYETLYPVVARSLQRILPDARFDYEDLVQTSFERIVAVLLTESMREVLSLKAWASGVAAHVALDSLRNRVRERRFIRGDRPGAPPMLELARAPNAERHVEARNQLAIVQDVLGRMKAELAETVLLHDMVGHDLRETATLTRVSISAAQSRLVRGRQELVRRVRVRLGREGT